LSANSFNFYYFDSFVDVTQSKDNLISEFLNDQTFITINPDIIQKANVYLRPGYITGAVNLEKTSYVKSAYTEYYNANAFGGKTFATFYIRLD
jgi:hypothetical protein